jgi:hypothetical protein
MRQIIAQKSFDQERALYHLEHADVTACHFAGPADGESALKEARDITVKDCSFSLRYPLWHVQGFTLSDSTMDEKTRAALWYDQDGTIKNLHSTGIKAVRECHNLEISDSTFVSPEFGWKSSDLTLDHVDITSEYAFLDSKNVTFKNSKLQSKYAFQYMENLSIQKSILITKDSFWHSVNVVVEDSIIQGEYLGWYSDHLTLKHCVIKGTQPLCYCTHLTLIDCTMEDCDLAFEYSDVEADIKGHLISIKNPKSGTITVDGVDTLIESDQVYPCTGKVIIRKK